MHQKKKMEIGIFAGAFSEFEREVELLRSGDAHQIELDSLFLLNKNDKEIERYRWELYRRNISIYSVHAPFGEGNDLASPEEKEKNSAISIHRRVMEKMEIMEIGCLVIHPGSRVEKERDIPVREIILRRSIERLLKEAESLKIKLALENMLPLHPGYQTRSLNEIVDEFSSSFLGVCFDTGHANIGGGVEEEFIRIQEAVISFHLHDNDGTRDLHLQPPYGNIDWKKFFNMVRNSSYNGPLILEAFPWQGREVGWMKREVEMLRDDKILKKSSPVHHLLRCTVCGHFLYGVEEHPICYCGKNTL